MSALRLSLAARRAPASRLRTGARRSFQSSRVLLSGKESALHNPNRAKEIEETKQDQLQKQREGKGQWKDELASDSESMLKADRGDTDNVKEDIEQLQKGTVEYVVNEKAEKGA
ncbi:hypothetical protein LTR53_011956 [Teratosphaeriaceae sp. CCFEE 6253]|nr:hypothetical protein LTR53_011956 [Teratosphaeriaceae sp. CCFEE 6253]